MWLGLKCITLYGSTYLEAHAQGRYLSKNVVWQGGWPYMGAYE